MLALTLVMTSAVFVTAKRFIPSRFQALNIGKSATDYTGIYSDMKCGSGSKLTSLSRGEDVTVLYTLCRGDGKKLAYVRNDNGVNGYMIYDKLDW